jgi:hypothetical protein
MNQEQPDTSLFVEVLLDGEKLGDTTAHLERADLRKNGVGTGAYGFSLALPRVLSYVELDGIEVFVEDGAGRRRPLQRLNAVSRIVPETADTEARPVFILGSRRSGTSAVTHALLRSTRYRGPFEGHAFDLLAPLTAALEKFYTYKSDLVATPNTATMIGDTPLSYFDSAIADMFRKLGAAKAASPYWLDKTPTPEMIRAAPGLAAIWPRARFIFVRRRGFENLASHARKFPGEPFAAHCEWWAACMSAWLAVRPAMRGRALEIDQQILLHEPVQSAGLIADLLRLDEAERKALAAALSKHNTERTAPDLMHVEDGEPADWDDDQRRIFRNVCLPLFKPYFYAQDSRYFVSNEDGVAWRFI